MVQKLFLIEVEKYPGYYIMSFFIGDYLVTIHHGDAWSVMPRKTIKCFLY